MKEIEILVEVYENDIQRVKEVLKKFEYNGTSTIIDTYYYDPLRKELKPYEDNKLYSCLRIREKNGQVYLTHKNDVYEQGIWQYSDELETLVNDGDVLKSILCNVGFDKLLILHSTKQFYSHNNYQIVLEDVQNLGIFLEVELQYDGEVDYKLEKRKIQAFIDALKISVSSELNSGKPELFIQKYDLYNKLR